MFPVQNYKKTNRFILFFRPIAQYDTEDNSDVIFLVGEDPDVQRIPAHSWILIEKSPVFRAMFRGPLAENQTQNQKILAASAALSRRRHRTSSGNSVDKYVASSLSTIQDNEEDEAAEAALAAAQEQAGHGDELVGKPITFEATPASAFGK